MNIYKCGCVFFKWLEMAKQFEIVDEDERIIAGWASVEVVDGHGDIVPISELRRGMLSLMDRGGNILFGHSNKPVGKILGWEIRKHDDVDAEGLWIIAKIYKEYPLDDEVWRLIKDGSLRGFSIGAQGRKEKMYLKDAKNTTLPKEINIIRDLNLLEISIVPTPANPLAKIEEVNYVAKSIDSAPEQKEDKTINLETVLEKYKVKKELFEKAGECGLCYEIASIIKDVGDVDLGVRIWRAINLEKQLERMNELEKVYSGIEKAIKDLKEYEKAVFEARAAEVEGVSLPCDEYADVLYEKIDELYKSLVDIMKPFGKWDSFDDCVSDMKSQGYSEESAKRICGSLQAKLEEKSLDEIIEKYQTTLQEFGFPIFPRGGWPKRRRSRGKQTKITQYLKSGEYLKAAIEGLDNVCYLLEKAGRDYLPLLAIVDSVYDLAKAIDENVEILKDKRPPKEWFDRCVERTGRPALCGWVFYHHLYPTKPESKKEPDEPHTRKARARKRAWLGSV